jgi:hypothetical protein
MKQPRLQWIIPVVAALFCCLISARPALGQATNTGTVVGEVDDQSGAVIADASVTLTNPSAGTKLTTTTNGTGKYIFPAVPPGNYDITVTKSGFSTTKLTGLVVNVGSQATENAKMAVGSTAQTVEVQVMGTELQTLNSTVGQTISQEAIESLPSLNHDANTFTTLQPGVTPDGNVAGAVSDQNMFLLDGGNNSSDMDGNNTVYNTTAAFAGDPTGGMGTPPSGIVPTPSDSVDEIKVNTANQTADFDNSSGAQIELVTPRGSNRWHGAAYEYYLDNGFNANSWDNNDNDPKTKIPQYHYSRFGGRAGGFFLPSMLGGRWYIFGFYEGYRYPQSTTIARIVPSATLKAGTIIENGTPYNMTTVDPRGIGINPDVQAMWTKYEPAGNIGTVGSAGACSGLSTKFCDGTNVVGFKANMSLPLSSNDAVFRLDHSFSSKWNWFASYRYFKLNQFANKQYDIGGFFAGDKLGTPTSTAPRPLVPWFFVTGLTTNITSNITNDFHYSYLRNFWQWGTNNAPPQISGLGGAMEPFGESSGNVLSPFNVDTQDIRTRFWDGQDHFFSDNVTLLKGNHLIQFGGQYQRDFDYHSRSDNGGGINFTPTYRMGEQNTAAGGVDMTGLGGGYPLTQASERLAAAVLGIVDQSQVAYTRAGDLSLNPPLTHASDKDVIPFYNAYVSDTWHMKPSLTLTAGIGYTLEMPPNEAQGKQTVLVDSADNPVDTEGYLAQTKANALQGNPFNPEVGWALVGNVGSGLKYPYQPFYGSFSPRVGIAWNPGFSKETVIRGGYGRIYGRLNGVDLVLVPLLGVGLIQATACAKPLATGQCGPATPTVGGANAAFRVGVDGNSAPLPAPSASLPQPVYPGYNAIAGSAAEGMDPHFRPNDVDSFDLTIQRQVGSKGLIEVGYIGRLIHHEYQPININAVPYMFSKGGQQFKTAYANLEKYLNCDKSEVACMGGSINPGPSGAAYTSFIANVPAQPFFEAALAGTGYCNGYASCTAAVLDNEFGSLGEQDVWSVWSDLDQGNGGVNPGFNFPRTMQNTPILNQPNGSGGQNTSGIAQNASVGYGNYNGAFVSVGLRNWHGLTMQHNLTWSKSLGTGAVVQASSEYTPNDPFDLGAMYGEQPSDHRIIYNTYMVAQEPWFKAQHGLVGRVAGGWTLAPILTAGTGGPTYCNTFSDAQSFGSGDGSSYFDNEQCVFTSKYHGGHSAHFGVAGDPTTGAGTGTANTPVNMFSNPGSVFSQVRAPILGIDTKNPGVGPIMGQNYWNLDAEIKKGVRITETAVFEFSFIAANVLNHRQFVDPTLDISNPGGWGVLSSQQSSINGTPFTRQMEFGGRISF